MGLQTPRNPDPDLLVLPQSPTVPMILTSSQGYPLMLPPHGLKASRLYDVPVECYLGCSLTPLYTKNHDSGGFNHPVYSGTQQIMDLVVTLNSMVLQLDQLALLYWQFPHSLVISSRKAVCCSLQLFLITLMATHICARCSTTHRWTVFATGS